MACIKTKFIPKIQEENLDVNTTLFIFAQIVAENVNTKNLLVYYLKQDNHCIFDGVKDMLMELLSIELRIVFVQQDVFYSIIDDRPHILFIDDIIKDSGIANAMVRTVIPNTFVITRGSNKVLFNDDIYLPLYKVGTGKEKLELARWDTYDHRRKIELAIRVSVVPVRSQADLEEAHKTVKASSKFRQVILVTKYPDTLGLKKIVEDNRQLTNQNYAFVVFTNHSDITDMLDQKLVLKSDLVYNILKDGIWGGEYYVPVKNA